ncbi:MAG: hypothetical protein RBG13Loki_0955 [Promethearchaeota archaeon CR_4]|nr:MAG: hypothetical protein RBG13Loki_0955 [Candidatus Lokiarchaeota archaeon CR_4]
MIHCCHALALNSNIFLFAIFLNLSKNSDSFTTRLFCVVPESHSTNHIRDSFCSLICPPAFIVRKEISGMTNSISPFSSPSSPSLAQQRNFAPLSSEEINLTISAATVSSFEIPSASLSHNNLSAFADLLLSLRFKPLPVVAPSES